LLQGRRDVQQFTYDRGGVEADHRLWIAAPTGRADP
jgi:hypothetical protein